MNNKLGGISKRPVFFISYVSQKSKNTQEKLLLTERWPFLKILGRSTFKSRQSLLSYAHTILIALNVHLVLTCALQLLNIHVQLLRLSILEIESSRPTIENSLQASLEKHQKSWAWKDRKHPINKKDIFRIAFKLVFFGMDIPV